MTHEHQAPEEPDTPKALSATTNIQLGLIVGLLALCAGGFGVWIWWAATISAKLDVVMISQKEQSSIVSKITADIFDIQSWRQRVDAAGTPQVARRLDELKVEFDQIRRDFDIHKATTKP